MSLRVSYNEIITYVRKALEGMGFSQGEYEDAADLVGWAALYGLDGLSALYAQLPLLPAMRGAVPKPMDGSLCFDVTGQSTLIVGPLLVELAYAHAVQHGSAMLTALGCLHPHLLAGYLGQCAERGMAVTCQWWDQAEALASQDLTNHPWLGTLHFAAGEALPTLMLSTLALSDLGLAALHGSQAHQPRSVRLTTGPLPNDHHLALPEGSNLAITTPADFAASALYQIDRGIPVETRRWQELIELGKAVLVEATEESRRRGAGEEA